MSVSPTGVQTYTYTGTVVGTNGTTATCSDTLQVTGGGGGSGPSCTLSINPASVHTGTSAELTWSTKNLTSFTIDQGIGAVTPISGGSISIKRSGVQTYTYTGTGVGTNGQTVTCSDTLQVTGGGGRGNPSQCSLSFDKSTISAGESATLSWTTKRVVRGSIDHGIGAVTPISAGSISVSPTEQKRHTYVFTGTDTRGRTLTCSAFLTVTGDGGSNSNVFLSILSAPTKQPLAFISLSQIPYTGLELGPIGTAIYWTLLTIWSGAVAFLVFFKIMPWIAVRVREANAMVQSMKEEHEAQVQSNEETEEELPAVLDTQQGFRSLKSDEELSIDDIVGGLARATQHVSQYQKPTETVPPIAEDVSPYEEVDPTVVDEYTQVADEVTAPTSHKHAAGAVSSKQLIGALIRKDKESLFGLLRRSSDAESIVTGAIVLLDEVYRERIDGTPCDTDVKRICGGVDTSVLEQVIEALSGAVDTVYTQTRTGVKLALTRALSVLS